MAIPNSLAKSWEEFIDSWCLGNCPNTDRATTELALTTLYEFWPEYLQNLVSNLNRGLLIISWAVRTGLILDACKSLDGFPKILKRVKNGERSALSELKFAAKLIQINIKPSLEPVLFGK